MTKFTQEQLKKLRPCKEGFAWYKENIKTENLEEILLQLNNYRPEWSRWLMARVLDGKQGRRLAIFSARLVLHIYEDKHPNDRRVRECIDAAELYADGRISSKELLAKRRAAAGAYYAAYADAAYAADAAYDAAYAYACAADAAACAYSYAAYAAYDADAACTDSAKRKVVQEKIIREVIRLLEEEVR